MLRMFYETLKKGAKVNVFVAKEGKILREPYSQAVRIILNKYYKL
jgi:hypothetical protein